MDFLRTLIDLDTDLFLFLNEMHNLYFDYFMHVFSSKLVWIPMYVAIVYVIVRNFPRKSAFFCIVAVALAILFADQVGATLIRPYVERLRPSNVNNPVSEMVHLVNNYRGGRYGFPSCHAANTSALAFFVFFLLRRGWLTAFMMTWAVVTCYSRVYLGVHYPGDLLVGILVGLVGAYLMYLLFVKVSEYRRREHVTHVNAPALIGLLTVVGIGVYAAVYS